ncbi:unnamed protein product [Colias eurytheme]|nr:unnamed protein product [Colias eurytheme]
MVSYLPFAVLLLAGCSYASRIVGGQDTTIEKYPDLVQMDTWSIWTSSWGQSCGANILTSHWILSAAHCFEGWLYSPEYRRIRAGSTYRNTGGVIHYVDYEVNHPDYGKATQYDADISVIRLLTPLVYTPVIQQGTIVRQNDVIPDNYPVVHAGWGTTRFNGPSASILQDVTIYVINNELCATRYLEYYGSEYVTKNMICAGILDVGGKDACQGDSGGPLYSGDVIVGVVSWGHGCANETYPGVSASVASYSDWVVATAR